MDVHDAAARLRADTGERAALLAALLDLEPGAIALARRLPPDALIGLVPDLRRVGDPGAMLAREALARGIVDVDEVVGWRARGLPGSAPVPEAWVGAPVLRALYREPAVVARCEQVRAHTAGWLAAFAGDEEERLSPEEAPMDDAMVLWAESCPTKPPALPTAWPARVPMSYWVEAVLRAESVHVWSDIARWGLALGHVDAVEGWLRQHEVAPSLSLDLRASALELRGRYEEAEAIHRESVREWQSILQQREHPLVANRLVNLAYILAREERLEEAEAAAREAWHIFERSEQARQHDVGLAHFCLAFVFARQGRYEEAEAEYRKSLLIDERVYGTREHPSVAALLVNLAGLLAKQGRYTEAEATVREAQGIFQRIHQKWEHRDVATSLEVLAGVLVRQGRYEEAIVAYQESIDILERVLGTRQHLAVIGALHRLALALKGWGRYAEAESALREAIASSETIFFGAQHTVHTIPLSCSLAGVLLVQERMEEALVLAREAWDAALAGAHTVLAIEAGRILVVALNRVKQTGQAREVERRIEALSQSLPSTHPLRQPPEPGERARVSAASRPGAS